VLPVRYKHYPPCVLNKGQNDGYRPELRQLHLRVVLGVSASHSLSSGFEFRSGDS
jgi:hypothetical protein